MLMCGIYSLYTGMPDVGLLQCLHKIAGEADVRINYVALGHHRSCREAYEMEANRVINLLKSAQLYDSARAFAKAALLSADSVTVDQVLVLSFDAMIRKLVYF